MKHESVSRSSASTHVVTPLLLFGVAVLHSTGILFGWYWSFSFFSGLLHFLGGMAAAAVALWIFERYAHLDLHAVHPAVFFVMILSAVALIGVCWEFFEFALDAGFFGAPTFRSQLGVGDTMGDLALDLLGGTILFGLSRLQSKTRVG